MKATDTVQQAADRPAPWQPTLRDRLAAAVRAWRDPRAALREGARVGAELYPVMQAKLAANAGAR